LGQAGTAAILSAIPNGNSFNLVQPWVQGYRDNTLEGFGRMEVGGTRLTK
jgi:hypothetical protein